MKVSNAIVGLVGLAGAGIAVGAPGEDPIKGGQTVNSVNAAAMTEDPIKGGQTFMAASGNDLGSPAPSKPNFSASPAWRAYAFDRGNVRYVQINDNNGVLRIVVAVADGNMLLLPMGVDAERIYLANPNDAEVVYSDGMIEIDATDGRWYVHPRRN